MSPPKCIYYSLRLHSYYNKVRSKITGLTVLFMLALAIDGGTRRVPLFFCAWGTRLVREQVAAAAGASFLTLACSE
ncbi:hypothetical protein FHS18_005154 [Paenibacillus phyllosphaerae]|uniref:Uncharacterized protein n=1 Tax=Paenibacillus phyllosphaerae TaxID=274593 RepID=A0A7W5FQ26_9BACL|nr:hypothetical protein [Paenibacillus phyllosphaerae]